MYSYRKLVQKVKKNEEFKIEAWNQHTDKNYAIRIELTLFDKIKLLFCRYLAIYFMGTSNKQEAKNEDRTQ